VREKLALISAYNSGLPLGIVADENGVRAREGAPQTENKISKYVVSFFREAG
jgi:hypothetical protein